MLKRLCIVIGIILAFTLVPYLAGTYLLPLIFNINISDSNIYVISFLGLMLFVVLIILIISLISVLNMVFYYIKYGVL